jgi:hypothetical protein
MFMLFFYFLIYQSYGNSYRSEKFDQGRGTADREVRLRLLQTSQLKF